MTELEKLLIQIRDLINDHFSVPPVEPEIPIEPPVEPPIIIDPVIPEPEPEPPVTPEPKPDEQLFFGYWDADKVPTTEHQNIYKVYLQQAVEYAKYGKIIPMIGGFKKDMSEADIRKRLRERKSNVDRVKESIEYILLMDEPFYKGFTPEHQELIIKCAKEEMGDYKYAYSYARGALVDQPTRDRRIPANLDVAMVNYYPFYKRSYIEKHEWWKMWITEKRQFNNDLSTVLDKLKSVPEIYLTGQGFMDDGSKPDKYRQPPLESVDWYVDACYKFGLKGVIWWLWASRSAATGMGELPDLYQKHVEVFQKKIQSNSVEPEPPVTPEPTPEPTPVKKHYGFWDHYISSSKMIDDDLIPYLTIGKSMSRAVSRINRQGIPAILHVGNLSRETRSQQESRLSGIGSYISDPKQVPIIHFIDEPMGHFSGEELDSLADYFRSVYGNKYKIAYTINSGELYYPHLRRHQTYAQKFDYVFHQTYPYRVEDSPAYLRSIGDTKEELFATLDLRLKTLKEKIPNSQFWIVGQGFHGSKWRGFPPETPLWYAEWVANNDVAGLLWWKYFSGGSWTATESMPEFLENIKKASKYFI